ncbi:hypothetical protein Hanom_Chr15g01337071 [Helianthus anomalus]
MMIKLLMFYFCPCCMWVQRLCSDLFENLERLIVVKMENFFTHLMKNLKYGSPLVPYSVLYPLLGWYGMGWVAVSCWIYVWKGGSELGCSILWSCVSAPTGFLFFWDGLRFGFCWVYCCCWAGFCLVWAGVIRGWRVDPSYRSSWCCLVVCLLFPLVWTLYCFFCYCSSLITLVVGRRQLAVLGLVCVLGINTNLGDIRLDRFGRKFFRWPFPLLPTPKPNPLGIRSQVLYTNCWIMYMVGDWAIKGWDQLYMRSLSKWHLFTSWCRYWSQEANCRDCYMKPGFADAYVNSAWPRGTSVSMGWDRYSSSVGFVCCCCYGLLLYRGISVLKYFMKCWCGMYRAFDMACYFYMSTCEGNMHQTWIHRKIHQKNRVYNLLYTFCCWHDIVRDLWLLISWYSLWFNCLWSAKTLSVLYIHGAYCIFSGPTSWIMVQAKSWVHQKIGKPECISGICRGNLAILGWIMSSLDKLVGFCGLLKLWCKLSGYYKGSSLLFGSLGLLFGQLRLMYHVPGLVSGLPGLMLRQLYFPSSVLGPVINPYQWQCVWSKLLNRDLGYVMLCGFMLTGIIRQQLNHICRGKNVKMAEGVSKSCNLLRSGCEAVCFFIPVLLLSDSGVCMFAPRLDPIIWLWRCCITPDGFVLGSRVYMIWVFYAGTSWSLRFGAYNQTVQTYYRGTSWVHKRLNYCWWTILVWKAQIRVYKRLINCWWTILVWMVRIAANYSSLMAQQWVTSLYISKAQRGYMLNWWAKLRFGSTIGRNDNSVIWQIKSPWIVNYHRYHRIIRCSCQLCYQTWLSRIVSIDTCSVRFLCNPNQGSMISYFWSPKPVLGMIRGYAPLTM